MAGGADFYVQLFALHEGMLDGDPTNLGDVARLVLEPLMAQLRRAFDKEDEQLLHDGIADALLEYGRNPSQANATAGAGVMGFLMLRAKSRVIDARRKNRRRDVAEAGYLYELPPSAPGVRGNVVELRRADAEYGAESSEESVSVPPPDVEDRLDREARIESVLSGAKTDRDRRILEMMLAGVRETVEYARVLGIEGEPLEVQEVTVKRHKDRLIAAAKRREEARHTPPKRRGRPPRRRDGDGCDRD